MLTFLNHDLIDEEIVCRKADIDDPCLPKHDMLTTWRTDFDDRIWFAIFAAYSENVSIDKVVILDTTNGQEDARIRGLLDEYDIDD